MRHAVRAGWTMALVAVTFVGGWRLAAQSAAPPFNDLPNPYETVEH